MLKIKLSGTKRDIRWFHKILERDKKIKILTYSAAEDTKRLNDRYMKVNGYDV